MRAFYQTEWLDLPFSNFSNISKSKLPDSEFYNYFYQALFLKYPGYEALDANWRREKDKVADWLGELFSDGDKVLSFGCGLGYMEHRLWRTHGNRIQLHVHDFASDALRWLQMELPAEYIHDTGSPSLKERFDLIYLVAVDYSMSNEELVALLSLLKSYLRIDGQIVLVSASFIEETVGEKLLYLCKETIKYLLEQIGLYDRGQFWGWLRSRLDYTSLVKAAELNFVDDGFIETLHQKTYWIKCNADPDKDA